jgi:hypothetical protein
LHDSRFGVGLLNAFKRLRQLDQVRRRTARSEARMSFRHLHRQTSTNLHQRSPVLTYETAAQRPWRAPRPGRRRTSRPVRPILSWTPTLSCAYLPHSQPKPSSSRPRWFPIRVAPTAVIRRKCCRHVLTIIVVSGGVAGSRPLTVGPHAGGIWRVRLDPRVVIAPSIAFG